jgi:hypothetical protein
MAGWVLAENAREGVELSYRTSENAALAIAVS